MVEKKDKLETLANEVMTFGATLFERLGPDKILPTWFAQTHESDTWNVAGTPWRNDTEKATYIASVKKYFAELKAVRYALLSETWVITRSIEDEVYTPPSEADDRKETLVVMAEDYKNSIMLSREIIRPKNGKPYLEEVKTTRTPKKNMSGTMTGMLPEYEGAALQ